MGLLIGNSKIHQEFEREVINEGKRETERKTERQRYERLLKGGRGIPLFFCS